MNYNIVNNNCHRFQYGINYVQTLLGERNYKFAVKREARKL